MTVGYRCSVVQIVTLVVVVVQSYLCEVHGVELVVLRPQIVEVDVCLGIVKEHMLVHIECGVLLQSRFGTSLTRHLLLITHLEGIHLSFQSNPLHSVGLALELAQHLSVGWVVVRVILWVLTEVKVHLRTSVPEVCVDVFGGNIHYQRVISSVQEPAVTSIPLLQRVVKEVLHVKL